MTSSARSLELDVRSAGNASASQGASAHKGPTFCVFTRITTADLPYVESFARHYSSIGTNTIYLMIASPDGSPEHRMMVRYLSSLEIPPPARLRWLDLEIDHQDPLNSEGLIHEMKEDYAINVDMDEYWVLPDGIPDLPTLVSEHPADIYYMRWAMIVSDDIHSKLTAPYEATLGFPGKWMAHRQIMQEPVGTRATPIHTVPVKEDAYPFVLGDYAFGRGGMDLGIFGRRLQANGTFVPGYMAHFWCRSFLDVMLKDRLRHTEVDCRPLSQEVTETYRVGERMQTLAFLALNERFPLTLDTGHDYLAIDYELEHDLAVAAACEEDEETAIRGIKALHAAYLEFKDYLRGRMIDGEYPELWPGVPLTMRMAGLSVTDWLESLQMRN